MFNFWKKKTKTEPVKSVKDIATDKGEPYIEVLSFELDPKNPSMGSFELDWNIYFVQELRAKGYQGKSDEALVDNWFTSVCRHIVLETYENDLATNKYIDRTNIGNGRTEVK